MTEQTTIHGGDIYRNQIKLDFSVNTNPLGVPNGVRAAAMLAIDKCDRYPDALCQDLRKAIAGKYKVNPKQVLCGNGASELFLGIVRAVNPKQALVTAPAFSGYEYALSAVQSQIQYALLDEKDDYAVTEKILQQISPALDMIFLCNPNNPTGSVMERELLEQIIHKCRENDVYVVVDQCFLEMTGRYEELCAEAYLPDYEKLIIVNAFTKTYAMAGLRLGYLAASESMCRLIRPQLSEWNVSIPAYEAGLAACREQSYVETSVEEIRRERGYLSEKLTRMGITCYPSDANFILLQTELPLYAKLLEQGILVRHCENYRGLTPHHYRIAVRSHAENELLLKAILKIRQEACRSRDLEQKSGYDSSISNGMSKRDLIQTIPPLAIEAQSFETITQELAVMGISPEMETASILKRVIHTTADYEYVNTLTFSEGAVQRAREALLRGATIVTDTNMVAAGIHKKTLEKLGGRVVCYMADSEVARIARERGVTRATVSMEMAAHIQGPCIFAIGNAPTALVQLYDMICSNQIRPELIIGVPVGFVNVVASKELIMDTDVPYIVNQGRKGGSNVAAAICNALLYQIDNER